MSYSPDIHNRQRKAAVVNDFTSFGRCSLAVSMPVLSAMKIQCCPVPTAFFTNHTGFESFSWTDNTPNLESYIVEWHRLGLRFDAIQSGFLGSLAQVDFVKRFVAEFKTPGTAVCIDPVMGDGGRLYATYDGTLAEAMRDFLSVADILTPNLTEACVLAGVPYDAEPGDAMLEGVCRALSAPNGTRVVVTGVPRGGDLLNFVFEPGAGASTVAERKIGVDRSGAGDVFAAVILGCAVRGVPFAESVRRASVFTASAVRRTEEMGLPETDGLAFEEVLGELAQ